MSTLKNIAWYNNIELINTVRKVFSFFHKGNIRDPMVKFSSSTKI